MAPRHRHLRELLALWESAAAGREMPDWQEMDRTTLRRWMGNLNVVEVVDGGRDFYCRIHGSNLVAIARNDATGRFYSSLPDIDCGLLLDEYRSVCRERQPVSSERSPVGPRKNYVELEKLMLPYTNGGADCGIILTGIYVLESRQPVVPIGVT